MLRTHTCQTVSPVAREARFSFLPVLFGADYLTAEACIYAYAGKYIRDYDGGEWTFKGSVPAEGEMTP